MNINFKQFIVKVLYFFTAIFLKKDNVCPYCLSHKYEVVFKKMGIIDICHCPSCYLYWTNPIFRLWGFYDFLYKERDLASDVPSGRQLKSLVDENFRNSEKDYSKVIEYVVKKYKVKRAVEFGSSWGYFLYQLKLFNVESVGVEISDMRRKFGIRKLGVKAVKRLEDLIKNKEKFDIIFSFHTLEHLINIGSVFKLFSQLLNEMGALFIETPNFDFKERKSKFKIIGAVHPLGFTKDFFLNNLSKEGFKIEIYEGYKDLIKGFREERSNLVVIGIKNR